MRLVTATEMRAADAFVIEKIGVPGIALMELAGVRTVDILATLVPLTDCPIAIFCGPGQNGGDGWVIARHLKKRGAKVAVLLAAPEEKIGGDALINLHAARAFGVELLPASSAASLDAAMARLAEMSPVVLVDALFGTGLARSVEGHMAEVIRRYNAASGIKVAVDIPSGLDADRGIPLGACVRADHTVTFGFAKRGLVTAPGFVEVGQLHVADIGIPDEIFTSRVELLAPQTLDVLTTPESSLAHKGTHGHVLAIAGSLEHAGAAQLCGAAALRAGAGLVTLFLPTSAAKIQSGRMPELMLSLYDESASTELIIANLSSFINGSGRRALLIGPGMQAEPKWRAILRDAIDKALAAQLGMVIDADGLNHLAADAAIAAPFKQTKNARAILTPHPGEAARLLGSTVAELSQDRIAAAQAIAKRFAAVAVLKGARTVIADPGGRVAICPRGTPSLGTGGTGDVLAGVLAALLLNLPQLDAFEVACAGVYWHGCAGEAADAALGRGFCASDLLPELLRVRQMVTGRRVGRDF